MNQENSNDDDAVDQGNRIPPAQPGADRGPAPVDHVLGPEVQARINTLRSLVEAQIKNRDLTIQLLTDLLERSINEPGVHDHHFREVIRAMRKRK